MKTFIKSSILISLILCFSLVDMATAYSSISPVSSVSPAPSPSGFCDTKCGYRCQRWGKESKCMHFCKMCCDKCQCVPSGTFGNKDECPCYRDWTSKQGKPKCP